MRKPQGYAFIVDPDKPILEFDTFTCNHCQQIVQVLPRCDPSTLGGFCLVCYHHICNSCQTAMERGESCIPWEKKMEYIEARGRALRSYGV